MPMLPTWSGWETDKLLYSIIVIPKKLNLHWPFLNNQKPNLISPNQISHTTDTPSLETTLELENQRQLRTKDTLIDGNDREYK